MWSYATYWKVCAPHSEQFLSSELSTQSSMPLQRSRESMQSPFSHWNSLGRQDPTKVLCNCLLDYEKRKKVLFSNISTTFNINCAMNDFWYQTEMCYFMKGLPVESHPSSSAPSSQSWIPSHLNVLGMHLPLSHDISVSRHSVDSTWQWSVI